MKFFNKISPILKKLLLIFAVVLALSACSDPDDHEATVVGERQCIDEQGNQYACSISTANQSCMSCEILKMMYDAVSYNVGHLHTEFSRAAMPITMVGFAIWLALRLLKFVSSVTETNAGEVWNEILKKAFICLICGMLASSPVMLQITMNTIVFPVYLAFLELGTEILQNTFAGSTDNPANEFVVFGQTVQVANVTKTCAIGNKPLETIDGAVGLPTSIKDTMSCMINMLSAYLELGGDIAWTAMKYTDSAIGFVMGVVLYLFFWVVKIGFVFYLVDTVFQMGIIILLLPTFIISYAFGPTKKWTGIGFSKVLASSGFMMCFSIIVALVLRAMVSLIANNPEIFNPEDAEAHMKDISIGFICLLLIGFLIYGSMGVSQQLTSGLIGAKVDTNFQKNMKAVVQTAVRWGITALGAIFTWGSSLAPQSNIRLVRRVGKVIKNAQKLREKMQRLAGRR